MEDIFDTENERAFQEKVSENEYNNQLNTIANSAFNEGYLSVCDKLIDSAFEEGFSKGKQYSFNFGKLIGQVDAFIFMSQINFDRFIVNDNDKAEMITIKDELENFQENLTDDIINQFKKRINTIFYKYLCN